ncbi:tripartite tricarboxylate transporter permease [Ilyobacter sp.]|uniref:tripartite tricarboxylate transporter permease n=1 Tax=Ilyobacter sp. TaxID=3100343 RepID=UPI003567A1D2
MLDIFSYLMGGFSEILTFTNLMWIFFGGIFGSIVGMLPGLGPATGIAVLLPLTFGMNPVTALSTLTAIYYGAMFGGSRASILINTPGDGGAIAATFDGYPMTKNGRAGEALAMSAIASFIGGTIATILMTFLAVSISKVAIKFGPPQYFTLMIFALIATSAISRGNVIRGLFATSLGLMVSTIGADSLTGTVRYTMGIPELYEGVDFLIMIIGFYAIGEVYNNFGKILFNHDPASDAKNSNYDISRVWVSKSEFKECLMPILRSTPLGFFIGILPGAGATISSMLAYSTEKSLSKDPDSFGKGNIIGLAAPEAANNATAVGAMIPMLTLGIPGSGTTAVMLGALMMLGIKPGPMLFTSQPDVAWGVLASMYVSNIMLAVINIPLASQLVKVLKTPEKILLPLVVALGFIGTYALSFATTDFIIVALCGIIAFFAKKLKIPISSFILALILGTKIETSFRQSMVLSKGSMSIFASDSISIFFIVLAVLSLFGPMILNKLLKSDK